MAVGNIKRGFNRLFIVAMVAWAIYCTVVYPFSERTKANNEYQIGLRGCYETYLGQGKTKLDDCLKREELLWQTAVDEWSVKNFNRGAWPLILAAIVGLPLLVYGIIRGIATLSLWVWRGYKAEVNP